MWNWIWIGWFLYMVVADFIADRTPGATFSEHCRVWFHTLSAKVWLGLFLVVLYLHIIANWPVWPVIVGGVGIMYFIKRSFPMRWDKWFEGLAVSGLVSVGATGIAFFSDGKLSSGEIYAIIVLFLGGALQYMKGHPPVIDDAPQQVQQKG